NTRVAIYDGDVQIGNAYAGADGSWYFPVPTLGQGEHFFTVVTAGVTSDPFTLTIGAPDSLKPSIDHAYDDFGKTGELATGSLTDDTTPTLIGKAEPNTRVAIYDGDVQIGNAYAGADGSWYFPVPTLGQGEHFFTVVTAGVTSDPFTLTIGAPDSIKPTIDSVVDNIGGVTELVSGSVTDDARPTFQGQGEPNTTLKVYDNGKIIDYVSIDQDGHWAYTGNLHKLSEGEHLFTFAGDGVVSEPFALTVQNVPEAPQPQIDSAFDNAGPLTGSVANGGITDDDRPVFSGRGEPDAGVFVYDNNVFIGAVAVDGDGSWTFQPSEFRTLTPGAHTFTVEIDGVRSEPFVLNVEAASPQASVSAYEGLPSLADLLQSSSELFVGETDIAPISEAVLDLSLGGFDESLALVETTDGIPVFSPVISPELWQPETAHTLG
ncbi:Ig-like domain-containing protein, partial [Pseudomonas sp. SDO524_S393]